jgi:hypothetical protein
VVSELSDKQAGANEDAERPTRKQAGARRWCSFLWRLLVGIWHGWPSWAQGIAALLTIASIVTGAFFVTKKDDSNAHTPSNTTPVAKAEPTSSSPATATKTQTATTTASAGAVRYLDELGASEVSTSSSEDFGTGLGTIANVEYPHSILQIYGNGCCEKALAETFQVPEGFSHFDASIGLETGGTYTANSSPTVLFEVDTGTATHRAVRSIMVYNEKAEAVEAEVAGQREIVLRTTLANTEDCVTCKAAAVWGNARFTP